MIHFVPNGFESATAAPFAEAVARLAGIRTALSAAEQDAGIAPGAEPGRPVVAYWPPASEARRRCSEKRSVEAATAAAAGLEILAAQQAAGAEANPRFGERLALTLRTELAGLDRLFSL